MKKATEDYIKEQGLDQLIDFNENAEYRPGVIDPVVNPLKIPIPPNIEDLIRIHQIIRTRKCFTALEFGVGYSTVLIADALQKNEADWNRLPEQPAIRNRFMFQAFSVDASKKWLEVAKSRIPTHLKPHVNLHYSEVKIGTHNGQVCHFYQQLPDIIADFIYVDGPDPKDVQGEINGMSFQCPERTVMAGDLLLMESTFLPGTFILFDGRTNNARFIANNLKRNYEMNWDREGDVTTFELKEERLGRYNLLGSDFF